MYRQKNGQVEVLLLHPGGPYWQTKDNNAWSIPKGEFEENETPLNAAKREFEEETGIKMPEGGLIELGTIKQLNSKIVYAWAVEADPDLSGFKSNLFEMEWPPKSGKMQKFPEADKLQWFDLSEAYHKLHKGQGEFLHRLAGKIGASFKPAEEPGGEELGETQISLL